MTQLVSQILLCSLVLLLVAADLVARLSEALLRLAGAG
jgi:hypothetical protein